MEQYQIMYINIKKKHDIWQYTSTGNIPGINGNVDMNISYKNIK